MKLSRDNNADHRSHVLEVPIEKVRPNRHNTRVRNEVNIESLAEKIRQYGFTSVLTAYEMDGEYVLLSGHRRLAAAQLAGMKTLPIHIVPRPESVEEERFIIATLQGEFRDWTKFEWGRVIYERWIRACKPDINVFMMDAAVSSKYKNEKQVRLILQTFTKLPRDVLQRIRVGELSFEIMLRLAEWVTQLEKRKPDVTQEFTTSTIVRIMVDKLDRKMFNARDLQKTSIFNLCTDEQLKQFLGDKNYTGKRLFSEINYERRNLADRHRATLASVQKSRDHAKNMEPRTAEEWESCIKCLALYEKALSKKINELEAMAFHKDTAVIESGLLFP